MNIAAVDQAIDEPDRSQVPRFLGRSRLPVPLEEKDVPDFVKNVMRPILAQKGDSLPVSAFEPGRTVPRGHCPVRKARRGHQRARMDRRPTASSATSAPLSARTRPSFPCCHRRGNGRRAATFDTLDAMGKEFKGMKFRIQVNTLDCMGCGNCADICPAKTHGPGHEAPGDPDRA
jgi:pyruvate-ferredoxin/flavodoxin oxidoreductase